jgi:hypothetical protein
VKIVSPDDDLKKFLLNLFCLIAPRDMRFSLRADVIAFGGLTKVRFSERSK